MGKVEIVTVTNQKQLRQFIQFYYDLYRGNEYAVPYLFFDEMSTLQRSKNPSFECCESEYFMAFRDGKMASSTSVPTSDGTSIRCASAGSTSLTILRCLAPCSRPLKTGAAPRV